MPVACEMSSWHVKVGRASSVGETYVFSLVLSHEVSLNIMRFKDITGEFSGTVPANCTEKRWNNRLVEVGMAMTAFGIVPTTFGPCLQYTDTHRTN